MLIPDYKTLAELVKPLDVIGPRGFRPIKGFCIDSRSLEKGEAFLALRGKHRNPISLMGYGHNSCWMPHMFLPNMAVG